MSGDAMPVSMRKFTSDGVDWYQAIFFIPDVGPHEINLKIDGRDQSECLIELREAAECWREYKLSGWSGDLASWLENEIRMAGSSQ